MAKILGILTSKRGAILPYQTVIVRIAATDPTGDTAEDITDINGNYNITVSNTGTTYNLYVGSEAGGSEGSNYAGQVISSGDVVSSFVLGTDSTFKVEHYGTGESETLGTHKAINCDSLYTRTGGYQQTEDLFVDLRLGSTNRRLRIDADQADDVFWLRGQPVSGADDYNIGIRENYNDDLRILYFGMAKTYFIDTDGDFYLNGGTIAGAIAASGAWSFSDTATFANTNIPMLDTYLAPTDDREFAPKKYVTDQIAEATLSGDLPWKKPVEVLSIISDADQGGFTPGSPYAGDAYISNNWGIGYTDDHIYEFDGSSWIDLNLIVAGTRVLVIDISADGSFNGQENKIGTYSGTTWSFSTPEDGWVVQVTGNGSYYENRAYTYNTNTSAWERFNSLDASGNVVVDAGAWYYSGAFWRHGAVGSDYLFQHYESESWVTKETISV